MAQNRSGHDQTESIVQWIWRLQQIDPDWKKALGQIADQYKKASLKTAIAKGVKYAGIVICSLDGQIAMGKKTPIKMEKQNAAAKISQKNIENQVFYHASIISAGRLGL